MLSKLFRPHAYSGLFTAVALLLATPAVVNAYDVEADSSTNILYILLRNLNTTASFDSISVADDLPAFVTTATASIVPASVAASSSDLAAVEFDVAAGALLGATGDITVTLAGTASGQPVDILLDVPLVVVADAAVAQGEVGSTIPAPDPGGVDTDMDGVSDALETAFGSDPNDPASTPGNPVMVPALHAMAWWLLAGAMLFVGFAWFARGSSRRLA